MKIHFYLDKRAGKINRLPIFLHFWHKGRLLRAFTGEHCDLIEWDKEKERVNYAKEGAEEINGILSKMEQEVLQKVRKARLIGRELSVEELKSSLSSFQRREHDFFRIWDDFVSSESVAKKWKEGTIRRFNVVKNHLEEMNLSRQLTFQEIDISFGNRFIGHQQKLGLRENYIRKNIDILKWFLNWASGEGYPVNPQYRKINTTIQKQDEISIDNIFLSPEEVIRIYSVKTDNQDLSLVRDIFCFCCLTGLGYSDIINLGKDNIRGSSVLYISRKTGKNIEVPLVDLSKDILDRYSNGSETNIFNAPPIQAFNIYLKVIGRAAGLDEPVRISYYIDEKKKEKTLKKWELLSSQVAKRTFISIGAIKGIGLEVMAELTGYLPGTIKSYYRVGKRAIKKEMQKLNKLNVTD